MHVINALAQSHEIIAKWSPLIKQTTGITENAKISWLAKYCHNHDIYESQQMLNESNSYALTGTVNGMGATRFPGNPGSQADFGTQSKGSGDKAHSLLPLAMQVAAQTIAFDLVPVVPMPGPMGVLAYLDYVYGNGKIGSTGTNAPELIKATGTQGDFGNIANPAPVALQYVNQSRIDGKSIYRVLGTVPTGSNLQAQFDALTATVGNSVELVKALEDHVTGFSGASYGSNDPYSREAGEATMDNVMNLTLCNKSVEAKTFQVAAAVTREQVQDLKQYGVDALAQIESVLINELTQSINKNILDRLFRLGDLNHANIIATQGINFFLYLSATATTVAAQFGTRFVSVPGATVIAATENAASPAENLHTRQRKIMSKILAISNMISIRGRRGPATFAITNGQVATALQDCAGFTAAPMANTINQASGSLFPVGSLGGVSIYIDPNMDWNDTRICVGRKGDGNSPGLIFMPYLIAETVQTIAEGTMGPKLAIKSRYALVEAGHHPETMYVTTGVTINPVLGSVLA
jgi:hypothetical protein